MVYVTSSSGGSIVSNAERGATLVRAVEATMRGDSTAVAEFEP